VKIKIITIGGYRIDFIKSGVDYYINKIKHFSKIEIVSLNLKDNFNSLAEKLKKQSESALKYVNEKDFVFLCDIKGKKYDSIGFAKEVEKTLNTSKDLVFIIGGDEGFDESLIKRANIRVSFSDLTFSHELFLVMLLEQIYRVFSIMKNYPYHK
jgi:23S rRNA (pseudouridine1915-N3)-methyltransferase